MYFLNLGVKDSDPHTTPYCPALSRSGISRAYSPSMQLKLSQSFRNVDR